MKSRLCQADPLGRGIASYADDRLAKLRPDFKYEVFSNYTGIQMMNEPTRWAGMVWKYVAPFER